MEIKKLSAPSNEDEIKQHWKYKNKVYISCVCITFNQKDYIRDTIDSFLAQETEYRFEIIIHDDVSTDGTRDILLEYKDKYPSLIKLILQDENQYKLGKKITPLAVEDAEGEYIALCEGDDFWLDKYKLQKQIIELENNKDINVCFTAAYGLDPKNNISNLCNYKKNQIFKFDDVILGGGAFMPTASLMIRKIIFDNLPDWFFTHAPVGDYFIQVLSSTNGAKYLNIPTVVYRINAINSWSILNLKTSKENLENKVDKFELCVNLLAEENDIINQSKRFLAKEFVFYAVIALKLGYFDLFNDFMRRSWKYKKVISGWQVILYFLRSFDFIFYRYFKLKNS